MKKLFLLFLLATSLTAFSQVPDTTVPLREYNWSGVKPTNTDLGVYATGRAVSMSDYIIKPDTLRAYILVTMCRRCAAEPMPGYVVIERGKRPVYLDCRKRALKGKQMGWGYEIVNPNYNLK